MHAKSFSLLAALCLLVASGQIVSSQASAAPYKGEFFPLEKVRRGQKGYGLTTMQGTTPERFEFEVIGVNRNFLPKMDIILVKSDDPKVQVTGFWQGMSGSPMFIEGKLTCAFSYGFRFNKVAIGGCTPLKYMIEEGFRPRRGAANVKSRGKSPKTAALSTAPTHNAASLADWLKIVPDSDIAAAIQNAPKKPWLLSTLLPSRPKLADQERGMIPSAVPLALSGFSPPAFAEAKRLMAGFPLEPMQAGGTGSSNDGPTEFNMGASIAVQLVRGDMSAAATGTVSLVDGSGVLAFGHPMFHAGEVYAPVASAEVHTVIPSAASAFVVASPMRELGSLTQDRQSTIAADTSLKVDMIPMQIRVKDDSGKQIGDFNVEIIDSRFFTANFAMVAASNTAALYFPDRDRASLRVKSRVELDGYAPIEFVDYLHSHQGASGLATGARGLRVIGPLMNNPFKTVKIKKIELDIEVGYNTNTIEIIGLSVPRAELIPGQKNELIVRLDPYKGKAYNKRIPFNVPKRLAGSIVRVEIMGGDEASLYIAPPNSIDDLLKAFRKLLPSTVYAITVTSAQEAASVDGRLISDLPASALNRLRTSTRTPKLRTRNQQTRSLHPAKLVLNGSQSILVKVGRLP